MLPFSSLVLSFSAYLVGSVLAFPDDSSDLTSFVSRPDIKAPRFDVKIHNKDRVSPGYWFVAPYWQIPPEEPSSRYMPCQIGPHIYDANGELIWTGACRFNNANVFDFKTVEIDNRTYITLMHNNGHNIEEERGFGLILDEQYREKNKVDSDDHVDSFNMHEFNVVENGKSVLSTSYIPKEVDMNAWGIDSKGWVISGGILEQDVSSDLPGWDYMHVNAVDKTPDGDYLLSSRFTDTIFMISKEGEVVWRLGGTISDFEHINNFIFHRQHHVQHVESNSTHMTISMLNNASDEHYHDGNPSSVFYILLDTSASPMTATLVRHYNRPDGDLTRLRGSAQTLPGGNIFAGWSQQGYHSEFTHDGEVVMEASFVSDRYSSYRSYKSEWTGRPTTPPDVKSEVFGSTTSEVSTAVWVSWNGATDIESWNFYGRASSSASPVLLGNARKTGFETRFMASGYMGWIEAEALDADGNALGKSDVQETIAPDNWQAAGFNAAEDTPNPMDPNVVIKTPYLDDSKQQPAYEDDTEQETTVYSSLDSGIAIFGLALAVVVGCGILFGLFWIFRPYLQQRSDQKTYLPVASEADGDDSRYGRN